MTGRRIDGLSLMSSWDGEPAAGCGEKVSAPVLPEKSLKILV